MKIMRVVINLTDFMLCLFEQTHCFDMRAKPLPMWPIFVMPLGSFISLFPAIIDAERKVSSFMSVGCSPEI